METTLAEAEGNSIFQSRTVHASRTLMVRDLATLLESEPQADFHTYKQAITEDNILMRKSVSARVKTRNYLCALYSLDDTDHVFRAMRMSYLSDPESLSLLAMLCGITRDSLLRATAGKILDTAFGNLVSSAEVSEVVADSFPDRFSASNLTEIGRRTLSSWNQSGHVTGRTKRTRSRAKATVGSVAFALYLGHLSGVRGVPLFETFWARLLDASEGELDSLAFAASQRGLMEYRRMGDVAEFGFSAFEALEGGL